MEEAHMRNILIAVVVAASAVTAPDAAAQETEVMAVVNQFVDGFNQGDTKSALAACGAETSIIDEFPPYVWHGKGACSTWASDFEAFAKENEMTDAVVTLNKARRFDVAAEHAYVVIPAGMTYKSKGQPMSATDAVFTVALKKGESGWRITGWSWAGN
jgi:hypothetical protein